MLRSTIFGVLCSASAFAGESTSIPDAPSSLSSVNAASKIILSDYASPSPKIPSHWRVIDKQFLILSAISTSAIFADSYTTTWIGNNYRSRGTGSCTAEGGEPQLYGLHPTIGRAYAIAGVMSGGAITVSFLAKKYLPLKVKWMWRGAFFYETFVSIRGFGTNLARC